MLRRTDHGSQAILRLNGIVRAGTNAPAAIDGDYVITGAGLPGSPVQRPRILALHARSGRQVPGSDSRYLIDDSLLAESRVQSAGFGTPAAAGRGYGARPPSAQVRAPCHWQLAVGRDVCAAQKAYLTITEMYV